MLEVKEDRLRWFGHEQRRNSEYICRRMMRLELPDRRSRGRPKRRFMDAEVSWCERRELDEGDDLLWRPLKGTAEKKRRRGAKARINQGLE